jgi:hypothetical protein
MKMARTTASPASFSTRKLPRKNAIQRDGGERVSEVVDEIGEQRDRTGQHEDRKLRERSRAEDAEA